MKLLLTGFVLYSLIVKSHQHRGPPPTLELVHLLYRHGDRAPVQPYPTDPYKDGSTWPEGFGQLTVKGKQVEYELGAWLRSRYHGFVSKTWIPGQVDIHSTDVDRTLMSAQANLAAFYFPDSPDRFDRGVAWLPTPIHADRAIYDYLLNVEESCPNIRQEMAVQERLPVMRDFMERNRELFDHLSLHSGMKIRSVRDFNMLYDTLMIEEMYGLAIPKWAKPYMRRMGQLNAFTFQALALTQRMTQLRAGPLLKTLGAHMKDKRDGKLQTKMYMYSAHDTTVTLLLIGMGVFNDLAPPYATTVMVELHNVEGERFVKMVLRNESAHSFNRTFDLVMPGCEVMCPLTYWLEFVAPNVAEDWDAACGRDSLALRYGLAFSVAAGAFTVAFLGLILAFTWNAVVVLRRRYFGKEYEALYDPERSRTSYGSIGNHGPQGAER